MKISNKLYAVLVGSLLLAGCEAGVVYEDVPESVYNNVELGTGLCNVSSRQIFKDQIYASGWDEWVEEYMAVTTNNSYQGGKDYTNKTSSAITILGKTIAPGEKVNVKNTITTVDDASAPDGKLYVVNVFANRHLIYNSQNSKNFFVASKFTDDFTLTDKDGNAMVDSDRSPYIKMPVKESEIVLSIILADGNGGCDVKRMDGSPILGAPGDFTQPRKYLVVNTTRRPDGKPAAQRMYEIRLHILP